MHVGVFLDKYDAEDGGAFTFQDEVLRSLLSLAADSSHNFTIVSAQPAAIKALVKDSGIGVLAYRSPGLIEKAAAFLMRAWPNLRSRLRWQSSFERSARRVGIDFVWFLSPRTKDIDIPYMTIVLDLQHRLQPWFPEVSRWGEWDMRERAFSRFLRRAAIIIAGTQAGKSEIGDFYQIPEERIHILPHPTPAYADKARLPAESEAILESYGLKPGYLLYPAQFWPHKNHLNLLLALKELKDEGLVLPLALAGSDFGNQHFIVEQIDALGLAGQVHMLGFVPRADLLTLYQHALALTYVTFFGPENLPPLEAFALGCPVIASRVSGAEEQLGEAALLVNPSKPSEIAATIRRVSQDTELRGSLVQRGQQRAKAWTTDDFVRAAFEVLDSFEYVRKAWGKN